LRGTPVFRSCRHSKSEKGTNGYDTANYNLVVGESLDAVRWPFARRNSTTLKITRLVRVFFRPDFFSFKFINVSRRIRRHWRSKC